MEDIFDKTYNVINPRLVSQKLYLILDDTEIKPNDYNYAKFKWSIINYNGEVILDGIEQIYDQFYEFSNNKKSDNQNEMSFEENLKRLNYKFVGDKFYLEY